MGEADNIGYVIPLPIIELFRKTFAKFGAFGQLVSLGEPSPLSPTPRPFAHATPPAAACRLCRCIRADYREPGAAAQGVATIMLCLHRLGWT